MGIQDHLTCLLRILYASQEATVKTGHGTTDWFQIEKGVNQGCILSPCLFNFYAEYIMRNTGLDKAQAGIKIARRNINNLKYADDTTFMAESEEELKILLMKVKEESEKKSWLKTPPSENEDHGIQFSSVAQSCLTLCDPMSRSTPGLPVHHQLPIDRDNVETVTDFFLGSKITADGDCNHEIKRCLLLGKKCYDKPTQYIKKQRHYFANKGPSSQSNGFPSSHVWM